MSIITMLDQRQTRLDIPSFRAGDTLRVHYRIREGDKERVQVFEGIVIAKHLNGLGSTFTVRKMSFGVGVERIFPLFSPRIARVEVKTRGKVPSVEDIKQMIQ